MPFHPEVQARAHEELDRVIGRKRMPSAEDEQDLPYVRAIIKEVGYSGLHICELNLTIVHPRFFEFMPRSGWAPRTAPSMTSSIKTCTFRRILVLFSTAMLYIVTKTVILIRELFKPFS
jgi:hypothetical protein